MAKARIPDGVKVSTNAFHIPASKGLIAASRYASHLVVGSRGLSGWTRTSWDRCPARS